MTTPLFSFDRLRVAAVSFEAAIERARALEPLPTLMVAQPAREDLDGTGAHAEGSQNAGSRIP